MFKITEGKGFHIEFANGYTMSVQWGPGNYCDNYNGKYSDRKEIGAKGSSDAETAVFYPDGEFYDFGRGDVQGYMSADDVVALMARIAAIPVCKECNGSTDISEGEVLENGI